MCYFSGPRSLQTCQHSFEGFFSPPFHVHVWLVEDFGSFISSFFSFCIPYTIFFALRDAGRGRAALCPPHTTGRSRTASSSNGSAMGCGDGADPPPRSTSRLLDFSPDDSCGMSESFVLSPKEKGLRPWSWLRPAALTASPSVRRSPRGSLPAGGPCPGPGSTPGWGPQEDGEEHHVPARPCGGMAAAAVPWAALTSCAKRRKNISQGLEGCRNPSTAAGTPNPALPRCPS